jgi:hypothetical protein
MTRYTVVWDDDAETAYLNAWIAGDSRTRAALTQISNWIDTNLAEDAELKGRAVSEQLARVVGTSLSGTNSQVSVTYRVLPEDRQVRVIRVTVRSSE